MLKEFLELFNKIVLEEIRLKEAVSFETNNSILLSQINTCEKLRANFIHEFTKFVQRISPPSETNKCLALSLKIEEITCD